MVIASFGQNKIDIKANFDLENKQIKIAQSIRYKNTSTHNLEYIYLNNWANSFTTKATPLAVRIAEEYKNDFHLAKSKDRGYSVVTSITQNGTHLTYEELKDQIDILKVKLSEPLKPNSTYEIDLEYIVKIPNAKFTSYGFTNSGDFNLRYWYITPAVYNGTWEYYSNKDLDDLFIPKADLILELEYPKNYFLTSELNTIKTAIGDETTTVTLMGKDRINTKLFLNKNKTFKTIQNRGFSVVSNINDSKIELINKVLITERVTNFLHEHIGEYPHDRLLISEIDSKKDPIYGLNFLPSFLRMYPHNFLYELKLLKTAVHNHLENTLLINPRKEHWLRDGIQIFYLMKYVEMYYPKMKFLGPLADFWGVRSFHIADMTFNEKYILAFMLMARTNRDQPLTMPKDSLIKFNKNIANKYKAGIGLKYLDDFINHDVLEDFLSSFLKDNTLKITSTKLFKLHLKSKTDKDIDWFFDEYLTTRKKIDFKIKKVVKTEDSITVTIKNKRNNSMPISLYTLNNDSIISKMWFQNITDSKTFTIPRHNANKLALNYNDVIPEINERDNWKSLKGWFFNNKPLQFRLFKDIEDPYYSQVFFMPIGQFNNIYDGLTVGMRVYNKTILRKTLNYKLEPQYSMNSKTFTGSGSVFKTHYFSNQNLYAINYGIAGGYKSYAEDLFVRQFTPSFTFLFRDKNDFRSNEKQFLTCRFISIHRDKDINNVLTSNEPNYNVFNIRYINSNDNLINFKKWTTDLQIAKSFSKMSFNFEYRRLFQSNRQLNIRTYSGIFLKNNNDVNSNYFSFALDRPTDYLFEYAYLGRSEASGLFSQQYITAEGGFKSKLETPYANQWISTLNISTTLWRYILLYGDIGFVGNSHKSTTFAYDSGIRLNLVTDYFEIYFPLYSNLGWETALPNYDERIRFKFTVNPQVLLGLFRRRWF